MALTAPTLGSAGCADERPSDGAGAGAGGAASGGTSGAAGDRAGAGSNAGGAGGSQTVAAGSHAGGPPADGGPADGGPADGGDGATPVDGGALDDAGVMPKLGPFVTVTWQGPRVIAFRDRSTICWIDTARDVRCRRLGEGAKVVQRGPFTALAIDATRGPATHGCALREDGAIACFGFDGAAPGLCTTDPQINIPCVNGGLPPTGRHVAISTGKNFACAIAESGSIACWGNNLNRMAMPPAGNDFVSLSSAYEQSCALTKAGKAQCWGSPLAPDIPSDEPLRQLELGDGAAIEACFLLESLKVRCDAVGGPPGVEAVADAQVRRISAGGSGMCALSEFGQATCAGNDYLRYTQPPLGPFLQTAVFDEAACGLRGDGFVECWGAGWGNGSGLETCTVHETRLVTSSGSEWRRSSRWRFSNYEATGSLGYATAFTLDDDDLEVGHSGFGYIDNIPGSPTGPPGRFPTVGPLPSSALFGSTAFGRSLWAFDATRDALGELYCTAAGSGSTIAPHAGEARLHLVAGRTSCPGTPVPGELAVCLGCDRELDRGAIDGVAWSSNPASYAGGFVSFNDAALAYEVGGNQGTLLDLTWGVLFTSKSSLYGEQVFCVGDGSLELEDKTLVLKDLSRIPPCQADGALTIDGCTR